MCSTLQALKKVRKQAESKCLNYIAKSYLKLVLTDRNTPLLVELSNLVEYSLNWPLSQFSL